MINKDGTVEKKLGIYIHIPFCVRKCLYCDFLSMSAGERKREAYVSALCREIAKESFRYREFTVSSIYIGGGTPSLLQGAQMKKILEAVYAHYRIEEVCEISMEANPGTVTAEKLSCWRKAGINRLSIGLQSMADEELKALGRIHSREDFYHTYREAVREGFENINVDLMSAIPGQDLVSWRKTLEEVTHLDPAPTHVSAYSLIIEEGTAFYENPPVLPDEDCEREMYKITNDILKKYGYRQYEISNYALPGYECRHNIAYWKRGNYAGFGIGAASLVKNERFCNTRDIDCYISMAEGVIKEEKHMLSKKEQMEEFMFLGLRMTEGVSGEEFFRLFGQTLEQVYPGIVERFCRQGLLRSYREKDSGKERIALTGYGIDVSNVVMAQFLLG